MKLSRFITVLREERAEPVLFHTIDTSHVINALESGEFQLGVARPGDANSQYQKGHPFYLSMAHSANASYGRGRMSGVTIEFDRNYLKARYRIVPIDYWQWPKNVSKDSEQEDRLLSSRPTLPVPTPASKMIRAIHIMIPDADRRKDWGTAREKKLIMLCHSLGIPTHIYDDHKKFHTAMPAAAKTIGQMMPAFKQPQEMRGPYYFRHKRNWLAKYRELLYKENLVDLSEEARRTLRSAVGFYERDVIHGLDADIHNARSSDRTGAIRILQDLRKFGLANSKAFVEFLKQKWIPKLEQAERERNA